MSYMLSEQQRLKAMADAPLPSKITTNQIESLAAEVRQTAEGLDPDRR